MLLSSEFDAVFFPLCVVQQKLWIYYSQQQGKLLQSVTGQMSNHICSVSAHFFPGLTKLAGSNNLPLIEMIECLAN